MKIDKATSADIPALVNLVNSAYRGETAKKGWTTESDLLDGQRTDADSLQSIINGQNNLLLKCTDEHEIVGCVFLEKQNTKMYLGMLTVSPNLQGKGTGKLLLSAAESKAKELGCKSVMMTVISVRHNLIAWYERHGYTITGEKKPFPNDPKFGIPKIPLEFIVLEKILA